MCLALVGCQTATTSLDDYIFVRTDGHRLADNPSYGPKFEIDKTICIGEVQKISAGATPIYFQGIGGAISAAMIQDQNTRALIDVLKGCMAQRGYVLVKKSEAPAVAAGFRKK